MNDIPAIYGDLVHDDAPGLTALFAGQEVSVLGKATQITRAGRIIISGGQFLCRSRVHILSDATIRGVTFVFAFDHRGNGLVYGGACRHVEIADCSFG